MENKKKKASDLLTHEDEESWFERVIVSNAPSIMGWFTNLVVIIADYRAYDIVYQLTGVVWKSAAASLACAIPFILWEIAWQYNHTTESWRRWSLAMAGLAFATSIFLGIADYLQFTGKSADVLLGGVVVLTGVHTVVGLLYYYNDPDVARRRFKAQTLGDMADQALNAELAETILQNGDTVLELYAKLESKYDPEEVEKIIALLQGKKLNKKPTAATKKNQMMAYAQGVQNPTNRQRE